MPWGVIVNADDFGLTEGVSRGILRAHQEGIVTATSVLTVSPAFAVAARWLDDAPDLAAGLHLAAVGEDPPLLAAREVPSLVDASGNFTLSSLRLTPRLALGRIDPADLEREFAAQYEAFVATTGRLPTHVDTHHNLHLWPSVGRVVADLARRWGVRVVRSPWSERRTPLGMGIRRLGRTLRSTLEAQELAHTDRYIGIDGAGRLDKAALMALIQSLRERSTTVPDATIEIAVHPGESGDLDLERYPWPGSDRGAELDALTSPAVRDAFAMAGFALVGPTALLNRPGGAPPPLVAAPRPRPARRSLPRP